MRRFTVSLPDDLYEALRDRCEQAVPPASLQQMVRFAVESTVGAAPPETESADTAETGKASVSPPTVEPMDLLAFRVGGMVFGLPVSRVETVAAKMEVHPVPSTHQTFTGVARHRGDLVEVHDGGALFAGKSLADSEQQALLALATNDRPILITVSSVIGLNQADGLAWGPPPTSAPSWMAALAWDHDHVITVVDPDLEF